MNNTIKLCPICRARIKDSKVCPICRNKIIYVIEERISMDKLQQLKDKVSKEFEKYRDYLLSRPKEEILDSAYQYAVYRDIYYSIYEMDTVPSNIDTLLASPDILGDIYREFDKIDQSDYMDTLAWCIGRCL